MFLPPVCNIFHSRVVWYNTNNSQEDNQYYLFTFFHSVKSNGAVQNLQQPRSGSSVNHCAAFGGHPHQSKIGSEEPIFDSFGIKVLLPPAIIKIIDSLRGAPPSREKPLAETITFSHKTKHVRHGTRLLPEGRSCQPPALRNRGLTDVGHRRRRQRYPLQSCVDLRRKDNILDILRVRCRQFTTHLVLSVSDLVHQIHVFAGMVQCPHRFRGGGKGFQVNRCLMPDRPAGAGSWKRQGYR